MPNIGFKTSLTFISQSFTIQVSTTLSQARHWILILVMFSKASKLKILAPCYFPSTNRLCSTGTSIRREIWWKIWPQWIPLGRQRYQTRLSRKIRAQLKGLLLAAGKEYFQLLCQRGGGIWLRGRRHHRRRRRAVLRCSSKCFKRNSLLILRKKKRLKSRSIRLCTSQLRPLLLLIRLIKDLKFTTLTRILMLVWCHYVRFVVKTVKIWSWEEVSLRISNKIRS